MVSFCIFKGWCEVILLLDVGNTQIFGGAASKDESKQGFALHARFRMQSQYSWSADEMGLFFRQILREQGVAPEAIRAVAIVSVVPDSLFSLKGAVQRYFGVEPFILQAGVKTGLKIKYRNPIEVGADRIANSIAAIKRFPKQNLLIVDLGTATTFCAVSSDKDYLGGAIIPGLRIAMESLVARTAKLPKVEIVQPEVSCGKSTMESIQSGLYFGHLGAIREFIEQYRNELFAGQRPLVLGTGGFAGMFRSTKIFDHDLPDLVLEGLWQAFWMNEGINT